MTETPLRKSAAIKVWVIPPTPLNAKGQTPQKTGAPAETAVAGYVFPWSWGWKESKQLIPISSIDVVSSMGQASFRLLRATRQEIGDSKYRTLTDNLIVGSWICITSGTALALDGNGKTTDQVDPSAILWVGWISAIEQEELAGTSETVGSVTALGIGHLLERRQIYGWAQDPETWGAYATAMNTPPQANIAGVENHVIGNAIAGKAPNDKGPCYVFARMPSDCAPCTLAAADPKCWTRWRLLTHLVLCCAPAMGGANGFAITIATPDNANPGIDPQTTTQIAGFLNDTRYPEVFDLQSLTWKGALDMLVPSSMGLGWFITVTKNGWTINVYSVSDDGSFGVPANTNPSPSTPSPTTVNLPGEPVTAVTLRSNADDMPDELVYESVEPCIFAFTISFADKNLAAMWTTTPANANQEGDYKAAGAGIVGYPTNTQQQIELNTAIRSGPGYRDVYTKFGLAYNAASNRAILRADTPVTGSGATLPLIPQLAWDGTSLTIDASSGVSRLPYLPTSRFLRTLPWPEGLWPDGTDKRDSTGKSLPQYKRLAVFRYDAATASNGGYKWVDLDARNGNSAGFSVSIDADDRAPALRITANPPELLAYKHWATGVVPTSPAPSTPATSSANPETDPRAIDYTKLVATVAMESDQKIQIIIPRPGTQANAPIAPGASANVRRSLIVRDDKLHCWITLRNTILALTWRSGDFAPDAVNVASGKWGAGQNGIPLIAANDSSGNAGVLLRNDWPLAQRRANMLAAFVFRKRTAFTIERARTDDQPAWAALGTLWSKVIEVTADTTKGTAIPEVSSTCGTVVVEVARTYGQKPRMRVSTGIPSMISAAGVAGGGASPAASGGGQVSTIGGGTLATQIADVKREAAKRDRDVDRTPMIPGRGGAGQQSVYTLVIGGGNTLSDGTTLGIKNATSAITTVPSIYDPTTNPSCIDGIGYATLFINNVSQGKVLVANYNGDGSPYQLALSANQITATSSATISIPLAGDPTQSVTCYLPYTP